ncbi:MAG: leucine-rich repeat protein [Firmicutes bacterium]|jgi:uncharacterized protein YjdB|nr:leucine-rich repeat protein [Bacillota bacterium]
MEKIARQKLLAVLLLVTMLMTIIPAPAAYAAGSEYGWQGIGAEGAEKKNQLKMLDPSDITVLHTAVNQQDYYENNINVPIDGTNGVKFTFTMDSGMNNFGDGANFRQNCMQHIRIEDKQGNPIAKSSDDTLKYFGGKKADEATGDEGWIAIGTEKGLLKTGDYVLIFGAKVCGNNTSKILGADIRFNFHVNSVPSLAEVQKEVTQVLESAETYEDNAAEKDKWGKYPEAKKTELQEALAASNSGDEHAADTLYQVLQDFQDSVFVGIEKVQINDMELVPQVGETGRASAAVTVVPKETKKYRVTWSVSPENGCLSVNPNTGQWTANYPGQATLTATATTTNHTGEAKTAEAAITVGWQGEGVAVNLSKSGALKEIVEQANQTGGDITALTVTCSKGVSLDEADFAYIKNLPSLKSIDLFKAECTEKDSDGNLILDFQDNTVLEKIVLPKTLKGIGPSAFAGCVNLKDIELPPSITFLGVNAFQNCSSLPETLKVWAVKPPSYVDALSDSFQGSSVKTIQVPYGCEKAYKAAEGWRKYNIKAGPERVLTVSNVQAGALAGSAEKQMKQDGRDESQVDTLVIRTAAGAALTRTEDIAWLQQNCLQATAIDLSEANLEDNRVKSNYFKNRSCLKKIDLPENIENLGDSAFAGCAKLETIVLPKSLTAIGNNAFQGCESLSDMIISNAAVPPEYNGTLFPDKNKTIAVPPGSVEAYKSAVGWKTYKIISQVSMALSKPTMELAPSGTGTLTATVTIYGNNSDTVTWSSSNPAVASVSPERGKTTTVTGGKAGSAVITAAAANGKVTASCAVTVTGKARESQAPAAPTLRAAATGYNKVNLTWSAVSGASGYEVFRAVKKNGSYSKIKTLTASARSCPDTGLATGTTYYYKVRAYKTAGDTYAGAYSNIVSVKPVLAKVKGVKAKKAKKGGAQKATVSWKTVNGASGYTVYRSLKKNKGYKAVKTVKGPKKKNWTVSKLKKGKKYYFKVRAYRTIKGKKVYGAYSTAASYKVKGKGKKK